MLFAKFAEIGTTPFAPYNCFARRLQASRRSKGDGTDLAELKKLVQQFHAFMARDVYEMSSEDLEAEGLAVHPYAGLDAST